MQPSSAPLGCLGLPQMHLLRRFLRLTQRENQVELDNSEERRNSILDMVIALDARMDSNVLKAWRLHA